MVASKALLERGFWMRLGWPCRRDTVYEVYEYQDARYDPERREGGLFSQYNESFLKLKAEARGYPDCVRDAENEYRYVREFSTSEGVALDKDAIRPNPAKRGISKLCLNSIWES
jgi:hypothetical protein